MRHLIIPWELPQNLLFDDFEIHWIHTQLDPSALRSLNEGWQGVFRRIALKCLPAPEIALQFSAAFGRPTKEIYSMIGRLVIMEFKQWTAGEAAEAYSLDAGVQFALNLARDRQYVCPSTVENDKRLLREGDEHIAPISSAPSRRRLSKSSRSTSAANASTAPTSSATWRNSREATSWPSPSNAS